MKGEMHFMTVFIGFVTVMLLTITLVDTEAELATILLMWLLLGVGLRLDEGRGEQGEAHGRFTLFIVLGALTLMLFALATVAPNPIILFATAALCFMLAIIYALLCMEWENRGVL